MRRDFLQVTQKAISYYTVGASTLRGQGKAGIIQTARDFCSQLDLRRFSKSTSQRTFNNRLNKATSQLAKKLSWGASRKVLNIFLRNCLNNIYLNQAYNLQKLEHFLEIPLDNLVSRELRDRDKEGVLPKWKGLKRVSPDEWAQYQEFARQYAKKEQIATVHLDTYLWLEAKEKKKPTR